MVTGLVGFIIGPSFRSQKKQHENTIIPILLTRTLRSREGGNVGRSHSERWGLKFQPSDSHPCWAAGCTSVHRVLLARQAGLAKAQNTSGSWIPICPLEAPASHRHPAPHPPASRGHCGHLGLLVVFTFPPVPEALPAARNSGAAGRAAGGRRRARWRQLFPALSVVRGEFRRRRKDGDNLGAAAALS